MILNKWSLDTSIGPLKPLKEPPEPPLRGEQPCGSPGACRVGVLPAEQLERPPEQILNLYKSVVRRLPPEKQSQWEMHARGLLSKGRCPEAGRPGGRLDRPGRHGSCGPQVEPPQAVPSGNRRCMFQTY